jgi:hypothetical protein
MKFFKNSASLVGAFLCLMSLNASADMTECMRMQDKNDKNYCMATHSGSATYCDKIASFERRQDCMRKVIAKQRSNK